MHDDVDLLVRHVEQEARLDHFQRLVHERRGIDGDLLSHAPCGMAQRRFRSGGGRFMRSPSAERAAGRGENEARQLNGTPAREALQHGAVLGVHGNDLAATLPSGARDQVPGHHEGLLVRQRDALTGAERREGRLEPRGADDPVDDDRYLG